MSILTTVESIFATYSFAKEVILVVFGAVFGGICTVIINNGAMRKQCRFDMQYKILKEEASNVEELYKKVEKLEIVLSFGDGNTKTFTNDIEDIQKSLLKLNERLKDKRKFVRKYMKAIIVEKSAQDVSDYMKILYTHGKNGIFDFQLIPKVDAKAIAELRAFEGQIQSLSNDMSEAMESLIAPGLIAKLKRKLRKYGMVIEECVAISKVSHRKK